MNLLIFFFLGSPPFTLMSFDLFLWYMCSGYECFGFFVPSGAWGEKNLTRQIVSGTLYLCKYLIGTVVSMFALIGCILSHRATPGGEGGMESGSWVRPDTRFLYSCNPITNLEKSAIINQQACGSPPFLATSLVCHYEVVVFRLSDHL